jgi:hypothetical protein
MKTVPIEMDKKGLSRMKVKQQVVIVMTRMMKEGVVKLIIR